MTVVFNEDRCTCGHPPGAHDDGFGCTEETGDGPCPCLAGWSIRQDQGARA